MVTWSVKDILSKKSELSTSVLPFISLFHTTHCATYKGLSREQQQVAISF